MNADEMAERAARFVEHYQDVWYPQYRKGARYLKRRPVLDFHEAERLVATWDDARLAKMAKIFLMTDHPFAVKGTRSIAQFASMASWVDSQLCEWEAKQIR